MSADKNFLRAGAGTHALVCPEKAIARGTQTDQQIVVRLARGAADGLAKKVNVSSRGPEPHMCRVTGHA